MTAALKILGTGAIQFSIKRLYINVSVFIYCNILLFICYISFIQMFLLSFLLYSFTERDYSEPEAI